MTIKPGYKTSEFWFTIVTFIFSGLYLIGVIGDNSHKDDLIRDVSHAVESVILIGGQLAIVFKYFNSRKQIKQTFMEQNNIMEQSSGNKPSKRTAKSRTRKSSKSK